MAFPLSAAEHQAIKARINGQDELIVAAAIRCEGVIIMVERPGRHGNCINFMHRLGLPHRDHGFVTNRGRFVDRQEAGRIVLSSEQGSSGGTPENNPHMALFSEDMWNEDEEPAHLKPEEIF